MSKVIQLLEVPKTYKEMGLNQYYMKFIEDRTYVPEIVVRSFLADVEIIRKENPIYNEQLKKQNYG